jgi:hypothetical protein
MSWENKSESESEEEEEEESVEESEEEIDDIQVLPVRIFIDNEEVIIDDNNNKIFHNNYWIKEYVKHCFKVRTKCKEKIIFDKTEVHIFDEDNVIKIRLIFFLKNNEEVAKIEKVFLFNGELHFLKFKLNNEWKEQYIKNYERIEEYEEICEKARDKYDEIVLTKKL